MSDVRGFSDLFLPEPVQWGLRGDPLLWRDMRRKLAGHALPVDGHALEARIRTVFHELTGHDLEEEKQFRVESYRTHGISSGCISPEFWRISAIPLLKERLLG
jgi:hypothetical protein